MPRARLPQLQSITEGSFEPNRKNPILLGEDSFLDKHQRPIRIGESVSPLSLSKDELRINGSFYLEGKLTNPLLETEFEYLELRAEENIRFTSSSGSGSLDFYVFNGDSYFTTSGDDFYFIGQDAGTFQFGDLDQGITLFQFDSINSKFLMAHAADTGDNFAIDLDAAGATTITTIDDDGTAAHFTLDVDGDIVIDAASGNITAKDNGGNYTPSSDYHIATKKYVDDNAGGSATGDSGNAAIYDNSGTPAFKSGITKAEVLTLLNVADGAGVAPTNFVTNDADDTMAGTLTIDKDSTATSTANVSGVLIDFDHTGITAGGQTINNRAFTSVINSNSPTHVGTVNNFGIVNSIVAGTSGTQNNYGIYNTVVSGDSQVGIYQNVTDGGTDLQLVSSADTGDYFTIATTEHGATTLATVDDDATAANLTLDIDGDIISDSHSGNFISKKAGTEFSVASSAYAGMILGYRMIGEDAVHTSEVLTTSFAVVDSATTVRFVAPPSGNVEIMVQIYANSITSNRSLYLGLSDNATYNTIGATYEHNHRFADETDDHLIQHYWTVTGLTAGDTYNYWLGARTSATNLYLNWGGTSSLRYPDFIMKATALPAATSDFAEYD